ncbi:MAG: GntP family permease [Agarilytica sp.]
MLSIIGLIGGLALLMYLSLKGMNLFFAAPICAFLVAILGDITVFSTVGADSYMRGYMDGFGNFIQAWFFVFLLGSLFGKLMEGSGAADSLAHWIMARFGRKHAVFSVVGACVLLTYGGVSLFVVAFSVYPMAMSLFRDANIPHRLIPATLGFGSVTFTMTSAGSPEIQNWIPIKYLGTTPFAAWEVSAIVALFMAVVGFLWLYYMVKSAETRGEGFGRDRGCLPELTEAEIAKLPHPISGFLPLIVVLGTAYVAHEHLAENGLIVALLAGCIALGLLNFRYIKDAASLLSDGTYGALMAIGNTSAVVGFGAVAKLSPAFTTIVTAMTSMDGNGLIGAAVAITTIAGLTGSASGGQTIALPELAPHYLENGVDPEHLHRITAISSGALDTLPHNGYVVTTIRVICNETHKAAYASMAALTVVVPLAGLALAIGLINLGL